MVPIVDCDSANYQVVLANSGAMSLALYPAVSADANRIAEIHMAAFASNVMLLAQFPTPQVREGLRESIKLKVLADINDPKITVLVIRDKLSVSDGPHATSAYLETEETNEGKVIAFAKWSHPIQKSEEYEETPWIWPAGTDMEVLESWGRATDEAQERTVGDQPCYRKSDRQSNSSQTF
jgi:hypothetical protein